MAQKHIDSMILKLIGKLPGYPALRVLDLSCGDAKLLAALSADGCACTGSRFKEGDYILTDAGVPAGVEIVNNVNLMEKLPFPGGVFDVVLLEEVIEHLPNHGVVIDEISRVLKPGGWFVLSTPNIHRLHSRAQFLFTGAHKLIRRRVGWDLSRQDIYAYHFNPLDFPVFHTLAHQSGFRIFKLWYTKVKVRHLYLALLYPLVFAMSWLEFLRGLNEPPAFRAGEADLFSWMTHPAMLFSEQLLIQCQKNSDS